MKREEILSVVVKHLTNAVDGVEATGVDPSRSMADYGASSLDIVSVVSSTMRELKIKVPRPELKGIATIGELVGLFEKHAPRARPAAVMRAVLFPGQGSQRPGMGRDLFPRFPEMTALADEVLGYSIEKLCLEASPQELRRTEVCQPALFVVGAMAYCASREDGSQAPDFFLGHSLGEYPALFAAEVFDFETGLRLVKARGELMAREGAGGLVAVIGLERAEVQRVIDENHLDETWVAVDNGDRQQVIGGPLPSLERAEDILLDSGAFDCVRLEVSDAFHTPLLGSAARELRAHLEGFGLDPPRAPVIANVTARPHGPEEVKDNLAAHLVTPVRFADCVRYLRSQGAVEFEENGETRVLTDVVRHIT